MRLTELRGACVRQYMPGSLELAQKYSHISPETIKSERKKYKKLRKCADGAKE
jgi:hypothetical protein